MGAGPCHHPLSELPDRVLAGPAEASLPVLWSDFLRRLQPILRAHPQRKPNGAGQTVRIVLSEQRLSSTDVPYSQEIGLT